MEFPRQRFLRVAVVAASGSVLALVGLPVLSASAAPGGLTTNTPSVSVGSVTLGMIESFGVTLQNTAATNDTIPAAFPASGPDEADFAGITDELDSAAPGCTINADFSLTMAPGAQCDIDVLFAPNALGGRSATLPIPDSLNAGLTLSVSGSGTIGYYQVSSTGGVTTNGHADFLGDASNVHLNHPIVGIAQTGNNFGYWLVAADGGIFDYGAAQFFGSAGGIRLNQPIVGMAPTPTRLGYWQVAADGGIFSYGDARFFGSAGGLRLNKQIVGMAATVGGGGYWLVASDGGIFSYGDAQFYGSTGSMKLNQPIVGMASTPDSRGYWLVAADGGIFAFGDAQFYGSAGSIHLNQPIVGMTPMPTGHGYWLAAADGGVFCYGDAPFEGALIAATVAMTSDADPTLQALGLNLYDLASQPQLRAAAVAGHGPRATSLLSMTDS